MQSLILVQYLTLLNFLDLLLLLLFMLHALFTSEGGDWPGAASAAMQMLYQTFVVKRELGLQSKLSIYQSAYVQWQI